MPQQKRFKILLVGDNCRDEYHYGDVSRMSPEAPVPVFKFQRSESQPGMAGNVEQNLKKLGCEVDFIRTQLNKKIRLIDSKSKYHITRIDYDQNCDPVYIDTTKTNYDAVVISDYNKGSVTYNTIETIEKHFSCPIFLDTKKTDLDRFKKSILKINQTEFNSLKTHNDNMIVTRGSEPVKYYSNGNISDFSVPKIAVHDVCGAGDTFLAAVCYEYLNTGNMYQSIKFAIRAASITVQHLGTYAPSLEEITCV